MGATADAAVKQSGLVEAEDVRRRINQRLDELLSVEEQGCVPITEAMRSSTLAPGKRIRPVLLVLTARGLGHDSPDLLDLACAIEMVHCASLILDDLPCMDDARMRRGQPTLHRRYGEDVATLASVGLLVKAFGILSSARGIAPEARVRMNQVLSEAIGAQGLVRGQYEDLHEASTFRPEHEIAGTSDLKTASLFRASVQIGALAAGAGAPVISTLESFACELGQAFQLFDDLNDNNPHSGKDRGQDQGKVTLLTLLGEQGACERLAMHLQKANRLLGRVYDPEQAVSCYVKSIFTCLKACLPTGVGGRRALAEGPGVAV